MTEVGLVSCSKSKQDGVHLARDLYEPSPIFRKRRRLVETRCDHWAVLSGRYGYLRPWDVVPYYEQHRNSRTAVWGAWVLHDLLDDLDHWDADQVTILAGQFYVDPLVVELEARGYDVIDPHRGLMPGERMSALNDALAPGEQATLVQADGGCKPRQDAAETADSTEDSTHD